jgi:hypothetical protein
MWTYSDNACECGGSLAENKSCQRDFMDARTWILCNLYKKKKNFGPCEGGARVNRVFVRRTSLAIPQGRCSAIPQGSGVGCNATSPFTIFTYVCFVVERSWLMPLNYNTCDSTEFL